MHCFLCSNVAVALGPLPGSRGRTDEAEARGSWQLRHECHRHRHVCGIGATGQYPPPRPADVCNPEFPLTRKNCKQVATQTNAGVPAYEHNQHDVCQVWNYMHSPHYQQPATAV